MLNEKCSPVSTVPPPVSGIGAVAVAYGNNGVLYAANSGSNTIYAIAPGTQAVSTITSGNLLNLLFGLTIDSNQNLYTCSSNSGSIIKIALPAGTQSTFATGTLVCRGIAIDSQGFLYVGSPGSNALHKVSPSGGVTAIVTGVSGIHGVAVANDWFIYYSVYAANTIYKVDPYTFAVSTFATASMSGPAGLSFASDTLLYASNHLGTTITAYTTAGALSYTLATGTSNAFGSAIDTANNCFTVANSGDGRILEFAISAVMCTVTQPANGVMGSLLLLLLWMCRYHS